MKVILDKITRDFMLGKSDLSFRDLDSRKSFEINEEVFSSNGERYWDSVHDMMKFLNAH